jgi:hypothetical protein
MTSNCYIDGVRDSIFNQTLKTAFVTFINKYSICESYTRPGEALRRVLQLKIDGKARDYRLLLQNL